MKEGVDLAGIRTELLVGLLMADSIYQNLLNKDCIVTAVRDGKHKAGSKHYVGLAADLRTTTAGIARADVLRVVEALRRACGAQFDVVAEADHIHLEFDPKEAIL